MSLLLDTCAILWLASEPDRLSDAAREAVTDPGREVFVSAISAGEIACLAKRQRVLMPSHWRTWFRQAVRVNGWLVLPVELETIEEAYSLPEEFHADPADRFIVATARLNRLMIITGDAQILAYPHVESLA